MPRWHNSAALYVLKKRGFRLASFAYRQSPVYYVEGGRPNAPTLVVLPGFGDNIFSWTRFLLRYADRYHVLGLDFPGFTGMSPHPPTGKTLGFVEEEEVAEQFLRNIAGRADLLVGNSMGGWIGMRLAAKHPKLIGHLAALNPGGVFTSDADMLRVRELFNVGSYFDYLHMMRHLWHKMPLYIYPFSLLGFYQFTHTPLFRELPYTIERGHFVNDLLAGMSTPITVIWGQSDALFGEEMGHFIAKTAPNARLHSIFEAGHMPQIEKPEDVYAIIDRITT